MSTLRMNKAIRATIENALRAAELERCAVAPEHQEAMRRYLDTWVAGRLREALRAIDGELPSSELRYRL